MINVLIFIGSESDRVYLKKGLDFLRSKNISYDITVISCHREPEKAPEVVRLIRQNKPSVIIAGAATATGLPGVLAGYLRQDKTVVLGVRFTPNPSAGTIEDASFHLSAMPSGVPLAYCGYNEKGFLFACQLAEKIL